MDKIIETAKKINELAKRGFGGEKINAEQMLEKIMKKHNITIEDLEIDQKYFFSFSINKYTKKLTFQIIYMVLGDLELYKAYGKRNKVNIKATKSEKLQIDCLIQFYFSHFEKEYKIFTHAFIMANNIYPEESKNKIKNEIELSKEKKNEIRKAYLMSNSIEKKEFRKQLVN